MGLRKTVLIMRTNNAVVENLQGGTVSQDDVKLFTRDAGLLCFYCYDYDLDLEDWVPFVIPADAALSFGIKPSADRQGAFLAYSGNADFDEAQWALADRSAGQICVKVSCNTVAMLAQFETGETSEDFVAEIQMLENGSIEPTTLCQFDVRVVQDILQGDEGVPEDAGPAYATLDNLGDLVETAAAAELAGKEDVQELPDLLTISNGVLDLSGGNFLVANVDALTTFSATGLQYGRNYYIELSWNASPAPASLDSTIIMQTPFSFFPADTNAGTTVRYAGRAIYLGTYDAGGSPTNPSALGLKLSVLPDAASPQPIGAGGTGSTTASGVRTNFDLYSTGETDAAITAAITAAIDALVGGAPGALDTLNELAAALDNDASFAASVTAALAGKLGIGDQAADVDPAGTAIAAALAAFQPLSAALTAYAGAADAAARRALIGAAKKIGVREITDATGTLALTDNEQVVKCNRATDQTITIPPQSSVIWLADTVSNLVKKGAGDLIIQGGTGVTVNGVSEGSVTVSTQFQGATCLRDAEDIWIVSGAIE